MTEDPTTAADIAAADAANRKSAVRSEALAALATARCEYSDLCCPAVEEELRAIHVSEDEPLKVFGVDSRGNVRTGPKGPESASDVVARLRADGTFPPRLFLR